MKVVFTYIPIRLQEITKIYLKYSIENLNKENIIPIIYSDIDYFKNTKLQYDWHEFDVDKKYKKNNLWSYPKLKVLSTINVPFIHLDNDLIVKTPHWLLNNIDIKNLNLAYKHYLPNDKINTFSEIHKKYSEIPLNFTKLNNTCIIASNNHTKINKVYSDVLDILELNYDFFTKKYKDVPPITLNQQYLNLYFNEINYLFDENPSYDNIDKNGICHLAEKNMISKLITNNTLV
jgi:hypothetical protein